MRKTPILGATEAVARIESGASLMVGGFGLVGTPVELLNALCATGVTGLTVISNNVGVPGEGLGRLLREGRVRRVVGSYFTSNREVAIAYAKGEIDVELVPQGNLAEAIRSGGVGVPAFFSAVGVGTALSDGAELRQFGDTTYTLVRSLTADFSLIHAAQGDQYGNLRYAKTAENFNPLMAMAARHVIASVDEFIGPSIDPDSVDTPGVFVDALVPMAGGAHE